MNLAAYFERIAYGGSPRADLDTLRELHRLHPRNIPFENLSTLLGAPVRLDAEALEDKLVRQRRGGYCFEQNNLMLRVLVEIGFDVTSLAARVVWNRDVAPPNPRTHMALLVALDGRRYLCDVGFGGATLAAPLEFEPGLEQSTTHESYRIDRIDGGFELLVRLGDAWRAAYEFDLQPQRPIDYEAMNHYVQTWPGSIFRKVLMAGRHDATGRFALGGNRLSRYESGALVEQRTLRTAAELRSALENELALSLPREPGLETTLERVAINGTI